MNDLLLNSETQKQIDSFIKRPSHALIILGSDGSGKIATANYIADTLLQSPAKILDAETGLYRVKSETGSISIDQVRQLQNFTKLKSTASNRINRVVIIENADLMTKEAQNALLKLLEEPPADTVFILTCKLITSLLPTIRSRTQLINVRQLSEDQLLAHFTGQDFEDAKIRRAFHVSQGRVGKMTDLLQENETVSSDMVDEAKKTLLKSRFEKIADVDRLVKQDKSQLLELVNALGIVCKSALILASQKDDVVQVRRWNDSLKQVIVAQQLLLKQANSKLALTNLMLNI